MTLGWNGKIFGFCSTEAAELFIERPEKYYNFDFSSSSKIINFIFFSTINKIYEMLLDNIHLILFFDVYDELKRSTKCHVVIPADDSKDECETLQMKDQATQTEVHPVPQFIDKDYQWNLWVHRQKAIELANLRRKTTKSAQTVETTFSDN